MTADHDDATSPGDQPTPVVTGSGGLTLRKPAAQNGDTDGE